MDNGQFIVVLHSDLQIIVYVYLFAYSTCEESNNDCRNVTTEWFVICNRNHFNIDNEYFGFRMAKKAHKVGKKTTFSE